ncbi:uncharacterized protein [Coffea arabica]|uniref:Uncharacterized protein n=1 Tax=Coffea arabica TaxID=13443 RepID=A0ABM4UFF3_COFAR
MRSGGRPFSPSEGLELMTFMEESGVFDAGFSWSSFTWCNERRGRARIWKRLDRLLVNGDWREPVSVVHLARHPSDHTPLKISFKTRVDSKSRPFRFSNVWTSKTSLLDVIWGAWPLEAGGSPLRTVCTKLLHTRRVIQEWNKEVFGNILDAARRAEVEIGVAEERAEREDSKEAQLELRKAQAELRQALSLEERFWSQKQRRVQGAMHRIKTMSGEWLEEESDIAAEAVRYFEELFSGSEMASTELV